MCITINKAALSKTKILSIPVGNGNHFIAYSNSVKNLSDKPNAMILAIPGTTKQEWFYDTTKYKTFLDDIIESSNYIEDYLGLRSRSLSAKSFVEKFQVGQYKVALTNSFDNVLEFINSDSKNIVEVKQSLINFYENHYKDWSFVVCLFDNDKTIDAQPIAFEYTPFNSDTIYFPTMDAHTGDAPNLDSLVDVDHTFIYEHTGETETKMYKEFVELYNKDLPSFLTKRKYRHLNVRKPKEINGDTFMSSSNISNTKFKETPDMERG